MNPNQSLSMKLLKCAGIAVICGCIFSIPTQAQPSIPAGTLPTEIAAAIRAAPLLQTLIPISGEEKFAQQIIKADEISFSENSRLTLTNLDLPWVVIAAKRIKFAKPEVYSVIQRDPLRLAGATGTEGAPGAVGADDLGETGRRGNDGHPGGQGAQGGSGETKRLPTIYLVAGEIVDPKGLVPAGALNLVVVLRGLDGGNGGSGGRGGRGGRAGDGKIGATSAFDCKEGGGPGGNGGAAGQGGRGGDGGSGGSGADLVLVTTNTAYEVLSFARINNVGGRSGLPGRGGNVGVPGSGGGGAGRNGFCSGTPGGATGNYPSPANLGDGSSAGDGQKGSVTAVIRQTVNDLFGK